MTPPPTTNRRDWLSEANNFSLQAAVVESVSSLGVSGYTPCFRYSIRHGQFHRVKNIHASVCTLPRAAFARQPRSEFIREMLHEHLRHFMLCPMRVAEKKATQLLSRKQRYL